MQRTFTIETSELDEKALRYTHRSDMLEFAFNSILQSLVNGARDQMVRDAKEHAQKTGEFLPTNEDAIILASTLPDADARHAEAVARAEAEAAERQRIEDEKAAELAAQEAERLRLQQEAIDRAVAAALAERDKNESN